MVFGKTRAEQLRDFDEWTRWFAWYPVRLESCGFPEQLEPVGRVVWLQYVWYKRYLSYPGSYCEYCLNKPKGR